ncbi:hypothetical protein LCGC14_0382910, partial [marine sediment metagenome]
AGGIAPFGTTPQQGFQQQLQQFAGASVPQFDPSGSAASLDPIIAQLTGGQAPQQPQAFGAPGMAGGGTVTPAPQPQSFLVGEKGPEVMTVTSQGVQVTPLAGGMAEGGVLGFPFEPIDFTKETLLPALGTSGIFGSLGFDQIPTAFQGPNAGIRRQQDGIVPFGGGLTRLGIQPSLIRFGDDPSVFFRNAQGELQHIPSRAAFEGAGFDFGNVVSFDPSRRGQFNFGSPVAENFQVPIPTTQPSAFTPFTAPIIEPTTGTLLPAPFTVASQLNKLRLTDPFTFNLLLSAYESAGVPAVDVLATVQQALPFGQARTNIGLN